MSNLSAVAVARLRKPGKYYDGKNLALQITKAGSKSWIFRYRLNGRERAMGLGPLDLVSLAEARDKATEARKALKLEGVDPIEARVKARQDAALEAARGVTFEDCAGRYIAAHEAGWRNPVHRAQWKSTLATYAYPTIGKLPVSAVDTALVLRVLEPVWHDKPETAGRVRGRIERILDWAAVRGYRRGDNPARWRGHLAQLLPSRGKIRAVKHHPALPYKDLPAFMVQLRARDSISARALEFAILTAARTGEAIGATWEEIAASERLWRIPGPRMKAGKPHTVPLAAGALEILAALPRINGNPYVFPGAIQGKPLSNMALLELMRDLAPDYVPHGFRSTFRDWAAECTAHPSWVAEAALAHVVADKVEAAYRRGELLAKRRALMTDWAVYCGGGSHA
jgi:integrase